MSRKDFKFRLIMKRYKKLSQRKRLKPQSEKRKRQNKLYSYSRQEFIQWCKDNDRYFCIFCGQGFSEEEEPDIHHLMGRDDDLLLKTELWRLAHRRCHAEYHHVPAAFNSWFEDYLKRVFDITELYVIDKERLRRSRASEASYKNKDE